MTTRRTVAVLTLAPVAMFFASLFVGRFVIPAHRSSPHPLGEFFPTGHDWPASVETIVMQIRLPRSIMAMFVGAGLAASGAAYQGMFRNPLVSPDILA